MPLRTSTPHACRPPRALAPRPRGRLHTQGQPHRAADHHAAEEVGAGIVRRSRQADAADALLSGIVGRRDDAHHAQQGYCTDPAAAAGSALDGARLRRRLPVELSAAMCRGAPLRRTAAGCLYRSAARRKETQIVQPRLNI